MSWITKWTSEINKMSTDILTWGNGVNDPDSNKGNFFKRNKTKLYTLGLFSGMGILFYYTGFVTLARVCLIILAIQLLSSVWNFLKETFN